MTALPRRTDRVCVLGILNVTPDSFSDGGRWVSVEAAVEHGIAMHRAGADLVDIGGESTRPGASRVAPPEEIRRVLPVLEPLVARGVPLSIDTTSRPVAEAALAAGAQVVNDVSGGRADPTMAALVRDAGCPWILMHSRGEPDGMSRLAHYDDVVADVRRELLDRVDAAVAAGVDPAQLAIDPGLGFAKTAEHNWSLLAALDEFVALGMPVLIGASRKSFLGRLLAAPDGEPRPVSEREDATTALTATCGMAGVWGVRVHEVPANVDAALAAAALRAASRVRVAGHA